MRWEAHIFLNQEFNPNTTLNEKYGFKTKKELDSFEKDLLTL